MRRRPGHQPRLRSPPGLPGLLSLRVYHCFGCTGTLPLHRQFLLARYYGNPVRLWHTLLHEKVLSCQIGGGRRGRSALLMIGSQLPGAARFAGKIMRLLPPLRAAEGTRSPSQAASKARWGETVGHLAGRGWQCLSLVFRHCFQPTNRYSTPLKVVAANRPVQIQHLPGEIELGNQLRPDGARIDLRSTLRPRR